MSNRGPSIRHGVFLQCAICNRAGLAPGCPTHAQSKRHLQCTLGESACTWFSVLYGQGMRLQLHFFAIALQSNVNKAVQYFCIGPHFVPKRDIKKVSFSRLLFLWKLLFLYIQIRHLGSVITVANLVSFDFNVVYSSYWGNSLINTLKLKTKIEIKGGG